MTSDWLYPLSGNSGRFFIDGNGVEMPDTSFSSFQKMMSRPNPDDRWYLTTNFLQVAEEDRVWCYYGVADGDLGVVGLGTIRKVINTPTGVHDILITWDRTRTRRLMKSPVPAGRVREFIARPRSAVQNVDRHPELRDELLRHAGLQPPVASKDK